MTRFDEFRAAFKGEIVTPHDPTYEQAIDRWAANAQRRAAVVAFVNSPQDVVLAIKYAKDATLRIAIRGGGHSAAGTSSTDGGLVIDLSKHLNKVNIDPYQKLAYVQGGAEWRAVDEAAIKHGLAAVAGTVNHTGVGGLSVGGGYGWLSGAHGLVIDNIAELTVVTADRSILLANEKQNPELFWGIRGGGSNFGVVTEFVFKLHPQRTKVFPGPLVFHPDKCEQIGAFLDKWWPAAKLDEGMLVGMTRMQGNPVVVPVLVAVVFFNGIEEEGRRHYKDLLDVDQYTHCPLADNASEIACENLNETMNPLVGWGASHYFKGALLSRTPSEDINPQKQQRVMNTAVASPDLTIALVHEFFPHKTINSIPPDAMPYRRDLPGHALIDVQWKENTPENSLKAKEIADVIAAMVPQGEGYGNYTPDSDTLPVAGGVSSDKTRALFGEHYSRLQAIKKKYDPDMVFNQWYTIVPA